MLRRILSWRLTMLTRGVSGIRLRIVLLVLVAIAPLLFDRVRTLEANRAERIATAGAQALVLARASAEKQEDVLISARSVLLTVSHAIGRVPLESSDCNRLMADVASDVPWMKAIAVANRAGKLVCASNPRTVGLNVSDRDYFHRALTAGGFAVSDLIYPRSGLPPSVLIAYGGHSAGQANSIIVAVVDLRWIGQFADAVEQQPGVVALLVDRSGMVLAAQPNPAAWIGRDLTNEPLIQQVLGQPAGTVTAPGFDDMRRIWGYLPVSGGHAYMLVGIDEREALASVDRAMGMAYVQLALISVLVLLAAWLFGEHMILRPIRALARAAERIGRGDLTVRTGDDHWAAEFLPLTRSLNSMAARLAVREHTLRTESAHFRELAAHDALTGLCNRRAFDAAMAAAWERAAGNHAPLALMMIDVDHFKRYNDLYGHLTGDACLRSIAAILLASTTLPEACAARYGGEEFALLVPDADNAKAAHLAVAIRRSVQDLAIPHAGAPVGVVTVSIGLASLSPAQGAGVDTLIAAADDALYRSKHGRNTVTVYAEARLAKAS